MRLIFSLFIFIFLFLSTQAVQACESCAVVNIGHKDRVDANTKHRVRAKVMYEQQDWQESPAMPLHNLHHQGKHVHDKQNEDIIHTMLTIDVLKRFSLDMNIPYVTKHYIEVDSHPHAGENQTSKGLGDVTLTGDYRLIQDEKKSLGIIAGLKLPTGRTNEHSSFGTLIEPELQPGTGSLDYIGGLSASLYPAGMDLSASVVYIYRTQGKQDFRAGDLLSVTLRAGKVFDLQNSFQLKTGAVLNNQLEKKQNNEDGFIKDSGGYTMLIGPQVSLGKDAVSVELSYLAPAMQNLGGVHQELDTGIWTAAVAVKF